MAGIFHAGVTPDWARHSSPHPAMQKASAGFAPPSTSMAGMLEPLPVSFPRQSGSLGQQQSVSGPLTSMSQPSLRPPYSEQPRTSSPFVPQEMQVWLRMRPAMCDAATDIAQCGQSACSSHLGLIRCLALIVGDGTQPHIRIQRKAWRHVQDQPATLVLSRETELVSYKLIQGGS